MGKIEPEKVNIIVIQTMFCQSLMIVPPKFFEG